MELFEKISKKYEDLLPEKVIEDIKNNIPENISEKQLSKIFEKVYKEYVSDLITPGEAIGLVAAGSLGEPGTQMTLNTFHLAGVSEVNITLGLPRIIEVLDVKSSVKTPITTIYLKDPYNKGESIKEIAMRIKETTLGELVKEFEMDIVDNVITMTLNMDKLKVLKLTPEKLVKVISKGSKKMSVSIDNDKIIVKYNDKKFDIKLLYREKDALKKLIVSGIKGLSQVLPVKKNGEYLIMAVGTNLKAVLKLDFVDPTRTYSNDIIEVNSVLGIEAARQMVFNEIYNVLSDQGISVDSRYLSLIADTMTASGELKGITRYGLIKDKISVLARASFETPIIHLIDAALSGETDPLNSVVENVMLNQPIPVGTGLPGVYVEVKK